MSAADSLHFACSCEDEGRHIGRPCSDDARRLTDEEMARLYEYRNAFSLDSNDKRVAEDQYSDGVASSKGRSMRQSNRAVKHRKQWKDSQQERSILRYSTGG